MIGSWNFSLIGSAQHLSKISDIKNLSEIEMIARHVLSVFSRIWYSSKIYKSYGQQRPQNVVNDRNEI